MELMTTCFAVPLYVPIVDRATLFSGGA